MSDAQTSLKPGSRVLLESPEVQVALGIRGVFDPVSERVKYDQAVVEPGKGVVDLETFAVQVCRAFAQLEDRFKLLLADHLALTDLVRSMSHGAVSDGLQLTLKKGSRQLLMSGGKAVMFERDGSGYAVKVYTVPVQTPLRFAVVSGDELVDEGLHDTLPGVCAGEAGTVVAWPKGTYRVDMLALAPRGETPIPEWYLFLGAETEVKDLEDVPSIPTPAVPAAHAGVVLPMYRIVSRQGAKGVALAEPLANRVGRI